MKIFGVRIILEDEYKMLTESHQHFNRLVTYHYWFSGWPSVYKVLHAFAKGDVGRVSIERLRQDFADEMGTDEWGNSK